LLAQHVTADVLPALAELADRFEALTWERSAISAAFKETLAAHGLKMPKLAMPVRVLVTGEPQTPAIDATLELIGQDRVVSRLKAAL
jgi:glutamyl-tRNA synthetase